MLCDTIIEPLPNLDKCILHELISILQKIAKELHQGGFGSYVAHHMLKEKIDRYNRETMIPRKSNKKSIGMLF